jgi:hypothetical protein
VVECDLAKVEVAGSNPVSRSRFYESKRYLPLMTSFAMVASCMFDVPS